MATNQSDGKVQIDLGTDMCSTLENQNPGWHQVNWHDFTVGREFASKIEPDGVWQDENSVIIIAECYARIGKLRKGQHRKIASDVLKLISLKEEFTQDSLRLILVVPEDLGPQLEGNDWLSMIISKEIELFKVPLSDEQRNNLLNAIKRQGEGQAHSAKPDGNSTV